MAPLAQGVAHYGQQLRLPPPDSFMADGKSAQEHDLAQVPQCQPVAQPAEHHERDDITRQRRAIEDTVATLVRRGCHRLQGRLPDLSSSRALLPVFVITLQSYQKAVRLSSHSLDASIGLGAPPGLFIVSRALCARAEATDGPAFPAPLASAPTGRPLRSRQACAIASSPWPRRVPRAKMVTRLPATKIPLFNRMRAPKS